MTGRFEHMLELDGIVLDNSGDTSIVDGPFDRDADTFLASLDSSGQAQ